MYIICSFILSLRKGWEKSGSGLILSVIISLALPQFHVSILARMCSIFIGLIIMSRHVCVYIIKFFQGANLLAKEAQLYYYLNVYFVEN